jgi:bacterial/archaeal transporter family-2 protein
MQYFLIFLAFLCGAVFPTQAGLNTKMAKFVGHPVLAAFFSFLTGLIGLMIYAAIARIPLNLMSQCRNAPWYVWFAGLLGRCFNLRINCGGTNGSLNHVRPLRNFGCPCP